MSELKRAVVVGLILLAFFLLSGYLATQNRITAAYGAILAGFLFAGYATAKPREPDQ